MSTAFWRDRDAVLFDLDGTLADTAADLCAAANAMRLARGQPALPLSRFRPWVSRGGKAMLEVAFPDLTEAEREPMLADFLARYGAQPAAQASLFVGMPRVLQQIEARGWRWGVVTNKPYALAVPVMAGLQLSERCGVLIGGDSLAQRKPDPLPLRVACERLGVDVERCVYVGDDLRDVQAAHAAGMPAIAAAWGYIAPGERAADWGADAVLNQPVELIELLGLGA